MSDRIKRLLSWVFLAIVVAGGIFGFTHKWDIYDYVKLQGYTPPPQIVQLATDTTIDSYSRHLFYVYHPTLEDKASFSKDCAVREATIVLGCYIAGRGIYLSNIDDPRLAGVVQVTAAHETLHAAYDRLSKGERARVNKMVEQAYDKLDDQRIRANIDQYKKDGADVDNELHSILGTEVKNLPPELEAYYKKYFDDRLKIVGYSENYEAAFTERKNLVAEYDKELDSLKSQIDNLQASLAAQDAAISQEKARLDSLRAQNKIDEYNQGVDTYNAMIRKYNADVATARSLIDQYNSLVKKRNDIALEENELFNVISNTPQAK
jgi:hypothetical protein